jgi:hypothetical protein
MIAFLPEPPCGGRYSVAHDLPLFKKATIMKNQFNTPSEGAASHHDNPRMETHTRLTTTADDPLRCTCGARDFSDADMAELPLALTSRGSRRPAPAPVQQIPPWRQP